MANFKKTVSLKGTFKNVVVMDGNFCDAESGEQIDVADILSKIYGQNAFDITTAYKADENIE